jgi:hypothetical protein
MTLDELERLEKAATAGPWQEVAESGDWWVEGAEGIGVCESNEAWNHQGDINLMVAARNALPALLRVARAARALDTLIDFNAPLEQECMVFAEQAAINAAMREAYAALAALNAGEEPTP